MRRSHVAGQHDAASMPSRLGVFRLGVPIQAMVEPANGSTDRKSLRGRRPKAHRQWGLNMFELELGRPVHLFSNVLSVQDPRHNMRLERRLYITGALAQVEYSERSRDHLDIFGPVETYDYSLSVLRKTSQIEPSFVPWRSSSSKAGSVCFAVKNPRSPTQSKQKFSFYRSFLFHVRQNERRNLN